METIIDSNYIIKILLINSYIKTRWMIGQYNGNGLDSMGVVASNLLMTSTLQKISEVSTEIWPNIDVEKEMQNPFWSEYITGLPGIISIAEVLFA